MKIKDNLLKIKNFVLSEKHIRTALLAFVVAQPVLDYHLLFESSSNSLMKFSVSTIIRYIVSSVFFIYLFANRKKFFSSKQRKLMIIYMTAMTLFTIIHHIYNLYYFKIGNYSSIGEIMYLSRFLILGIIYFTAIKLKITRAQYVLILRALILLIAGSIFLSNVVGYSLSTYSNNITEVSIIDWFTNQNGDFITMATKGHFTFGNQVSALLVFLFVLILTEIIINKDKRDILLSILSLVALTMLGTRVATWGAIAVILGVFILHLGINTPMPKNKLVPLGSLIVLALIWINVYPYSPSVVRKNTIQTVSLKRESSSDKVKDIQKRLIKIDSKDKGALIEFIKENFTAMSISEESITKKYSYLEDPVFWSNIFMEPLSCREDNRCIQTALASRILENQIAKRTLVNRYAGKLFGTGYTRMDSLFPIERDLSSHMYNLGLLGFIIFIFPLLYLIGILIVNALSYPIFKKDVNGFKRQANIFSLMVLIGSAYLSGNVLDSLFVMIVAMFFVAYFIKSDIKHEEYLTIKKYLDKVYPGTTKKLLNELNSIFRGGEVKSELIVTANAETIQLGLKDSYFHELLMHDNTLITADGISVVKAGRLCGTNLRERVTGVDVAEGLLEIADLNGLSLSVLGCKQDVLDKFRSIINKRYPNIRIVNFINGYVEDKQSAMKEIFDNMPDVLFVALGMGNQEKIIFEHRSLSPKTISVGVGGAIDVLSGEVRRAPSVFINTNTEWLYRIVGDKKRIKRFIDNNIKFMFRVLLFKLCFK